MSASSDEGHGRLLEGIRVVDLAGEPAAMAARILGDLGAEVIRVVPPGGDPLAQDPPRHRAWSAGKALVALDADDPRLADLLRTADVVLDTPGWPGAPEIDPEVAPDAAWVSVTPFGLDGPRSRWRASDLGIMAASGNMFCTGDPDRAPLRCAEPTAYAHVGPEAALAALTALASGRPHRVDVSAQETVLVANMGGPGRWFREGDPGRRRGANIGRTREIWPCRDGYVSFGIRGGKARVNTWATVTRLVADDGIDVAALDGRDWAAFNHNNADQADLDAISTALAQWFGRHTKTELYTLACEHNLTLAPINGPKEILGSEQFSARGFFGPVGEVASFPRSFVQVRAHDRPVPPVAPAGPPSELDPDQVPARPPARPTRDRNRPGPPPGEGGAWSGTRIVEFGSGAAGPIATRYFAEHGATVVRVESRNRPDFLRAYALGPKNPHGLDGAPMFDALNAGKLSIALDLKHPEGRDLALELVQWADAVSENFAPKAMRGLGLDYDRLVDHKPDLVMISACLNGQTGPHKDYPGFGGQGAALAGFNYLTGWPDREPVGPFGTITDSLAPRFVATALAAALLHRRDTGRGTYLDLSQVEAGAWALSPWLLRYLVEGTITERMGNRSPRAVPHGAFPCRGDDRWVAIAAWSDAEWARLASIIGVDDPTLAALTARLERADEVESLVAAWTADRDVLAVTEELQAVDIEAVPVQDFRDVHHDPQLDHRGHFVTLVHPNLAEGHYERNGFRLSGHPDASYAAASPLVGEHNRHLVEEILGLSAAEHDRLREAGVLE